MAASVDGEDLMVEAAANRMQVVRAAFFRLAMLPAYVRIAVVQYPLLRG